MTDVINNLKNKVLIATSQLNGTYFENSIVIICAHTEEQGAMGLVLNRPVDIVKFTDVTDSLNIIPKISPSEQPKVLSGGPVDVDRGFVLHSPEYDLETTIHLDLELSLTASSKIIEDIAKGRGPESYDLCLGYAGWQPLQLEQEIIENAWLISRVDMNMLFSIPYEKRYNLCLQNIGLTDVSQFYQHGNA